MPAPDRKPLITTEQLAEQLGVPPRTVEDWRSKGTGPAYVRIGKYVRYRENAVERWLDAQTVQTA